MRRQTAVLIDAGRIVAVGRDHDDLMALADGGTEHWDLRGATVLPGLIDTHPHLLHFAARQASLVDISDANSHDEIVNASPRKREATAAGDWIMTTPVGEPWYFIRRSYKDLLEGELPTRRHWIVQPTGTPWSSWHWEPNIPNTVAFNSMALARLGVTRELPDQVSGVTIEKDGQGEPTGRLYGAVNGVFSGDEFAYELWRKVPRFGFRPRIAGDPACHCHASSAWRHRYLRKSLHATTADRCVSEVTQCR